MTVKDDALALFCPVQNVPMFSKKKINLEFYIDIHAHSTMMNGFMYGNIFEDEERFQRQAVFPKLLCQNAEDFSYSSTSFNRDAVKAGTGRRFLGGLLNDTSYCYTLEVSFYSYILGGPTSAVPYTEEAFIVSPGWVEQEEKLFLTGLADSKPMDDAPLAFCPGFSRVDNAVQKYFPLDTTVGVAKQWRINSSDSNNRVGHEIDLPGEFVVSRIPFGYETHLKWNSQQLLTMPLDGAAGTDTMIIVLAQGKCIPILDYIFVGSSSMFYVSCSRAMCFPW
ncbi:hypothetical protein WISP_140047 [Willisornis vidua]|uniref:Cytosolic carboxypeptidase 6 n=1 Tax=Willisornis vidua TaxID=1566151 RepID=A0ABQ9CM93_9PASS|nr:hypothetical protein WISP_140047 [Willisornis vidua]